MLVIETSLHYDARSEKHQIQMNVCTNMHIKTIKLYTKHSYPSCLVLFNLKTCLLIPEYFMSGFTSRFILIWKLHKSIHFNLLQMQWQFLNKTHINHSCLLNKKPPWMLQKSFKFIVPFNIQFFTILQKQNQLAAHMLLWNNNTSISNNSESISMLDL